MQELITVNLVIGDRTYRVKVNTQDESTVRKTIKIINDKIIEFKTLFAGKDMQDYVSMVLLWFATQNNEQENKLIQNDTMLLISNSLTQLENEIDKALKE